MNLSEGKIAWSKELQKVAALYPAALSSNNWPKILQLANAGDEEGAMELARRGEAHAHIRARNVLARRMAIERQELFRRLFSARAALRGMFDLFTEKMTQAVEDRGGEMKNLKPLTDKLHDELVFLRQSIRICFNSAVRDAAKMGFRHPGDAILPIFKDSREAMEQEILAERALYESKLSFAVSVGTATAHVARKRAELSVARNIKKITQTTLAGLKPSEKIWDLTVRAEQDLKRIIANGMAAGQNPKVIARKIAKYVAPNTKTDDISAEDSAGAYRNAYRNAYRLTRTEMNRAYTKSVVDFGKNKAWVNGYQVTLSRLHSVVDDCDDEAGKIIQANDPNQPPFHPHCMCTLTPVIDPKYLGEEE